MSPSSPARPHLRALNAGQLSLPFQAEPAESPAPLPNQLADNFRASGPRQASETASEPQEHSFQVDLPKHREHKGKKKPPSRASFAPDAKLLVSRKVASEMLSISIRGVDYMIADGRLSTRRIANRVLISIEEIRKFAQSDHPRRLAG